MSRSVEGLEGKVQTAPRPGKGDEAVALVEVLGVIGLGIDNDRVYGDCLAGAHDAADSDEERQLAKPAPLMCPVDGKRPEHGGWYRIVRRFDICVGSWLFSKLAALRL